jgi:hypothetical protein
MNTDNTTNQQALIATHKRRLALLEEKRAMFGISVDPSIIIEIQNIEKKIKQLRTEMPNQTLFERKRLNIFEYITDKLGDINDDMMCIVRDAYNANQLLSNDSFLTNFSTLMSMSDEIARMNKNYKLLAAYNKRYRIYIPNDVNDLLLIHREAYFDNIFLISGRYEEPRILSKHLQNYMNSLLETMNKYI